MRDAQVKFYNDRLDKSQQILKNQLNEASVRAAGAEIRSGGSEKVMDADHVTKVSDGIEGLKGQINDIDNYLKNNPNISSEYRAQLENLRGMIQTAESQLEQQVRQAAGQAEAEP